MAETEPSAGTWPELNPAQREAWNRNAVFIDERMGEGNEFHRLLVGPAMEWLRPLRLERPTTLAASERRAGELVVRLGNGAGRA